MKVKLYDRLFYHPEKKTRLPFGSLAKTFLESKGCPGEPVLAGKRFLRTLVALAVRIFVGVRGTRTLAANTALRAVFAAGCVRESAGIAANRATRAVCGILCVGCALDGRSALVAFSAVCGRYVRRTGDLLKAVLANCAIVCFCYVVTNFSDSAANITRCIAEVAEFMRGIRNGSAAVFANLTVGTQRLVPGAFTNVTASVFAGNVMLVCEAVRRYAILSSACTVARCIAFVGIQMIQCRIANTGCGVVRSANGADLLFDLSFGTGCR